MYLSMHHSITDSLCMCMVVLADVQVKLVIFPASMSVDEVAEMTKSSEAEQLASHSLQMIFTGVICPIQEVRECLHLFLPYC